MLLFGKEKTLDSLLALISRQISSVVETHGGEEG